MGRVRAWWSGLSRGAKAIVVVAIVVVVGIAVASGQGEDRDANGLPVAGATTTPTQEPTQRSDPTAEPTPAVTPEPTPTPTPEPTPGPAFADITLSGTGDAVPRFEIPIDAAAIADITHTGSANFAIFTIGADGSQQDLLVNTIGNYAGTVLFDETDDTHSIAFEVTADGAWTITIRPVTTADAWDGTEPVSGTGDDVIRVDPPIDGLVTAEITHVGSSNFAVFAYGGGVFGADLLVNEIGNYSGESLIGSGTFLIEITADGAWSITPS